MSNKVTPAQHEPALDLSLAALASPRVAAFGGPAKLVTGEAAAPRLPIELAIAEDALEHEAREFISELVDVTGELRELIEAAE